MSSAFSMHYDIQQLIPFHVIQQEVRKLGVEHLLEKQTPCRPWYVRLVLFSCRRPSAAVQKLVVIGKITNAEIRYRVLRTFEGDPVTNQRQKATQRNISVCAVN